MISSAYCTFKHPKAGWGISLVYIVNKVWDNEEPCGTPASKGKDEPMYVPILIFANLFLMKLLKNLIKVNRMFSSAILY